MSAITDSRRVVVVGVGMHRYQRASETSFVTLGTTAAREALKDAGLDWNAVQSAFVATSLLGMTAGRQITRFLGRSDLPLVQVENASASGSSAFRLAVADVASGVNDVSIAIGVDKPLPGRIAAHTTGVPALLDDLVEPFTHFALLMRDYMHRTGATTQDVARVAVKNHANGALNPYAQRQQRRTLDEVLQQPFIAGDLTRLQCTPVGEGAAAVIVVAEEALPRLGIGAARAVGAAGRRDLPRGRRLPP